MLLLSSKSLHLILAVLSLSARVFWSEAIADTVSLGVSSP